MIFFPMNLIFSLSSTTLLRENRVILYSCHGVEIIISRWRVCEMRLIKPKESAWR